MNANWFRLIYFVLVSFSASAQVSVLTAQYDNARTGANTNERILNTSNVNASSFGKLFTLPVDGYVYAQPLYVLNLAMGVDGSLGIHNVIFVATMRNKVYAFDADTPGPSLWATPPDLGTPVPHGEAQELTINPQGCVADGTGTGESHPITTGTTLTPEIGILSTPVIDPVSKTLYVLATTLQNNNYCHTLHALDLATGTKKASVNIQASLPGNDAFSKDGVSSFFSSHLVNSATADPHIFWAEQVQRSALLLNNGLVYVAFSVYHDPPPDSANPSIAPWHGWVMAYDAQLKQVAAYNVTPGSTGPAGGGGIWQSGRGPAADPGGNIYLATGNGDLTPASVSGDLNKLNLSQSVLNLSRDLKVQDRFTPPSGPHQGSEDSDDFDVLGDPDLDLDVSAAGPMLIPGTSAIVQGTKEGYLYLLDANNLGKPLDSVQITDGCSRIIPGSDPPQKGKLSEDGCAQIHSYSYWNGPDGPVVYVWGKRDVAKAYGIDLTQMRFKKLGTGSTFVPDFPGGIFALSANRASAGTGILWATTPPTTNPLADPDAITAESQTQPGVLRAFDASTLSKELWNSDQNPADSLGNYAKFNSPTVANGKVYVPTFSNQVVVYGLKLSGDLNGDGKVDCADIAIVQAAFGTQAGEPEFDQRADVNRDGVVNVRDLAFVTQQVPAGTVCK